jgi:RimJ/RimL family protein N-acetyltransferase
MNIQLEPWGQGDLELLQALLGDPAMMEHLGGPESPEKIVERQARYVGNPGALKIVVDGVGAGWIGFWEREWQGAPIFEMGWSLLPPFQGRGIATEATRLALAAARQPRVQRDLPQGRLHVPGRGLLRVPEGRLRAQQRLGLSPKRHLNGV